MPTRDDAGKVVGRVVKGILHRRKAPDPDFL